MGTGTEVRVPVPKSDASFFDEYTVVPRDRLVEVRDEGILEAAKATLLAGRVDPGQVGEVGVRGASDHLAAQLAELLGPR